MKKRNRECRQNKIRHRKCEQKLCLAKREATSDLEIKMKKESQMLSGLASASFLFNVFGPSTFNACSN
jgi:hypothetical protein